MSELDGLTMSLTTTILMARQKCPDFKVIEGVRDYDRQVELFEQGASKTLNSKHLTGEAIDFIPKPFTSWNDLDAFIEIGQCFKDINPNIVYGGDWGWDYGHIELDDSLVEQSVPIDADITGIIAVLVVGIASVIYTKGFG